MGSMRTPYTPEVGKKYTNGAGGTYECIRVEPTAPHQATMKNIASGWTFTAHGCGMYDDGCIGWDYSTNGRFDQD